MYLRLSRFWGYFKIKSTVGSGSNDVNPCQQAIEKGYSCADNEQAGCATSFY